MNTTSNARNWGILIGIFSALGMAGAGIYLLTSSSASAESTVFDVFFDGIGIYFIARGGWVVSTLLSRGSHNE